MALLTLDGRALAKERERAVRRRATEVTEARGRPPRLLILAFGDEGGSAPWIGGKVRGCRAVGIEVHTLVIPPGIGTAETRVRFHHAVQTARADAVFVQFPFPAGFDGAALCEAIPPESDIDLMHPDRVRRHLAGEATAPPLTVRAILALLDAHEVSLADEPTTVVAHDTPFDQTLVEAFRRRGAVARMVPPPPRREAGPSAAREWAARIADSRIIITSLGEPGAIASDHLPTNAVVVDGGYFNPGGRGDLDLTTGVGHLRALAPVPGGVGPMTVSLLLEAVVERAEASAGA